MPTSPYTLRSAGAAAALLIAAVSTTAFAEDAQGCKDFDGFKRFEGSRLVMCDYRKFDEYVLPLGKYADKEDLSGKEFKEKRRMEGKVDKNLYLVAAGPSTADVARNYETMMGELGYTLLYQGRTDEDLGGAFNYGFDKSFKDLDAIMGLHDETRRFDAYVKDEGSTKTYVAVHTVVTDHAMHPKIETSDGEIVVRVDKIVVGSIAKKMEQVKASDMKKAMDELGRISLYGINFDFNKSDIKPDSRTVLDEIGKFLKDYPEEKLQIVGHTDNVGGADFNQKLSDARASAVVADLAATYKIDPARLFSAGAGMTAPVAPNDTDEGRAKNRRVELVKVK